MDHSEISPIEHPGDLGAAPTPDARPAGVQQVRFLQRTAAFRGLPSALLEQVAAALRPRAYAVGDVICREGDPAAEFFVIETGTVSILAAVADRYHELARLGPGESFGEVALLGDRVRTATVQAATPVRLWVLAFDDFTALMARSADLDVTMREIAKLRDRAASDQHEKQSLASLLAQKSEIRIGRGSDNDLVIDHPSVSRHHAVVRLEHDTCRLFDTSSNGTFVNGVAVRGSVALRDGDEIVIGDERLLFDRQGTVRVVEARGIRIDAFDLTKTVKGPKTLLHDISLSILAGELVAIVGGSGAGKTTLMDALSGIRPATSGRVLYNGRDYYRSIDEHRQTLGYVPQDDIIHGELSLGRTFRYAAELRLPRDTTRAAVDEAVERTFGELDLAGRADVTVKRLSGGQRKRASIGIELLTEPRIFFLDEPTSGLDPATEGQIMRLLRSLADGGRTVVLTTHATKNVMLCDRIVVLARDGHLAFVGPPADALRYFGVESFDDIYEVLAEQMTPEQWEQAFRHSPEHLAVLAEQQEPPPADATIDQRRVGGSAPRRGLRHHLHELWVLSRRNVALHTRSTTDVIPLVMQPIAFSVLLLALFEADLFDPGGADPTAPLQLVFLLSFNAFLLGLLTSVQEIVKELPIFFRERNVGVGVVPYLLSKVTFLVPGAVFGVAVMLAVLWATNRLPDDGAAVFVPLTVTLLLVATSGISLALFTSAFVRSPQQATDLLSLWIMPQVLFAGALLAVPAMNALGGLVSNIAVLRWGFEATGNAVDLDGVFRESPSITGRSLVEQYGTSFTDAPGTQWIVLAGFTVVPMVLAGIILRLRQPAR